MTGWQEVYHKPLFMVTLTVCCYIVAQQLNLRWKWHKGRRDMYC
jgi:putative effector of murein hydrolase